MKVKLPLHIVELEPHNFHVFVPGVFNDGTTAYWAVDTGASKSVFDIHHSGYYTLSGKVTERIYTAGIGENPQEKALGTISEFSMGIMTVSNLTVTLLDLSHLNELYSRLANLNICGLLGGDFLMKHLAVIDYRNRTLLLRTPRIRPFV